MQARTLISAVLELKCLQTDIVLASWQAGYNSMGERCSWASVKTWRRIGLTGGHHEACRRLDRPWRAISASVLGLCGLKRRWACQTPLLGRLQRRTGLFAAQWALEKNAVYTLRRIRSSAAEHAQPTQARAQRNAKRPASECGPSSLPSRTQYNRAQSGVWCACQGGHDAIALVYRVQPSASCRHAARTLKTS